MSTSTIVRVEAPEPRPTRQAIRAVGLVGAIALLDSLMVLIVPAGAWIVSPGFIAFPFWIGTQVVIAGTGIAAIAALVLGQGRSRHVKIPLAGVVVVLTGLSAWLTAVPLGISVPGSIQQRPGTAFTAQASRAASTASVSNTCSIVRFDPTAPLPTPFQRCAQNGLAEYLVNWSQFPTSPTAYGLVFTPSGNAKEPDTCQRHLGGPWWAVMGADEPSVPCASGFQFVGAP